MKRILLGLVFLLLSSTGGWNGIRVVPLTDSTLSARIRIVPRPLVCPGSYNYTTWTNCLGTYTWTDGDKYVGQWRDNKKNGYGIYTWADGKTKEGIWEFGKLKK